MKEKLEKVDKLVSVVIPTYNRALMLKRAVDSVCDQSYRNLQIIIVDDGSDDETRELVNLYNDSRIELVSCEENKGVSFARNEGLRRVRGDYIAFLDSDDIYYTDRISKQIDLFSRLTPCPDLIVSNYYEIGEDKHPAIKNNVSAGFLNKNVVFSSPVKSSPTGWIMSKDCFEAVGFFDEKLRTLEDLDYFVRVMNNHSVYYFNELLGEKIVHGCVLGGVSNSFSEKTRERLIAKWLPQMKKEKKFLADFYYVAGKDMLKVLDFKKASKYLWSSLFFGKFNVRAFRKLLKLYLIWVCNICLPAKVR